MTIKSFLDVKNIILGLWEAKFLSDTASNSNINPFIETAQKLEEEMFMPGAQYWQVYNRN